MISTTGQKHRRRRKRKPKAYFLRTPNKLSKTKKKYTHYSPPSGQENIPENYNTVTIKLSDKQNGDVVDFAQDSNDTEKARKHSEKNLNVMINGLKELLKK